MTIKHAGYSRDREGNAIPGALVYVYDDAGAVATVTDVAGNALTQPVRADAEGYYEFMVSAGIYSVKVNGRTFRNVCISSAEDVVQDAQDAADAAALSADAAAASAVDSAASALAPVAPTAAVAALGTAVGHAGQLKYASDGRKAGEGAGVGTGVLTFSDGANWIAVDTGASVSA